MHADRRFAHILVIVAALASACTRQRDSNSAEPTDAGVSASVATADAGVAAVVALDAAPKRAGGQVGRPTHTETRHLTDNLEQQAVIILQQAAFISLLQESLSLQADEAHQRGQTSAAGYAWIAAARNRLSELNDAIASQDDLNDGKAILARFKSELPIALSMLQRAEKTVRSAHPHEQGLQRLRAGDTSERTRISLDESVNETRAAIEALGADVNVTIKIRLSMASAVVADADQVLICTLNAAHNALEAMSHNDDDQPRKLIIRTREAAGMVRIVFRDTGPGFAANIARDKGRGLALCREIASAHGGTFETRNSRRGRGALVTLSLPIAR